MIDLKQWVIWTLRKASYRWPSRQVALHKASVSRAKYLKRPGEKVSKLVRNFYRCSQCLKVFSRKGVSIDHIKPVVDPHKGWQGFDVYIKRLFCAAEDFQVLCSTCHDAKTAKENVVRKKYKAGRKAAAERKLETIRKCEHCDESYIADATGIEDHVEKCPKNRVAKK